MRRDAPVEYLAVVHGQAPDGARQVRSLLAEELPDVEVEIGETGAVLGTHVGPGSIGLAYIRASTGL